MNAFLWFVAAAIAIPLAWVLLKTVLAFTVPDKISGALLFKQELKRHGIPYEHLPDGFFTECVAWADELSSFIGYGSKLKKKAEFVKAIEHLAVMIALYRSNPSHYLFASSEGSSDTYREMFRKYDLRRSP